MWKAAGKSDAFLLYLIIKPMMKHLYKILLLAFAVNLISCSSGEKQEELMAEDEQIAPTIEQSRFNAQNVFNSLPDRKLVLKLIEENKIEYKPDILNNPTLVNKYALEFSKAINLGIYGSDLSIASSFNQTQESMVFLRCVNVLAGSLGVNGAFDQRLFERIEANNNNKDSIIEIVTGAFKKVDEILKYNNRPATSAIILSGCWIEGLYVSCQMAQDVQAESIIKTILQQKETLKNLIVMLEAVKLDEHATYILTSLKQLHEAFETAEKQKKYTRITIVHITAIISELRNKATNTVPA
jgi:hypothetical protein